MIREYNIFYFNVKNALHITTKKLNVILVFCILAFASLTTSSNEINTGYGLFIKPESCIVEKKNDRCDALIEIQWKLKNNRDVCLYIKEQKKSLACWQSKKYLSDKFTIDVASNVTFQLRDKLTHQVIYSTHFSLYLKLAKYRKRRRNPWSFY